MAEIFPVETRGVGKPDYSRVVSGAKQRAGIHLEYTQQLMQFAVIFTDIVPHPYPVPWVQDRLGIGAQSHLYDISTGLVTPYNLSSGYTLSMIQKSWSFDQDVEMWLYMDGILMVNPGITSAGVEVGFNMLVPYTTAAIDPMAASAHTLDVVVINRGGAVMEGAIDFVGLLEKVGSPPWPTTKDCRCPFCGHIQTVPVGTTVIICDNCRQTYYVQDFSRIGEV